MSLPPGYSHLGASIKPSMSQLMDRKRSSIACKLRKSLYGLKQAPRQWFANLSSALLPFGFFQSKANYSLFVKKDGKVLLPVLVYVDDMIIIGNDTQAIAQVKTYLSAQFHMKDLGALKYFLGLEVMRTSQGIFLCQ